MTQLRFDKEGKTYTLEEDIQRIWKEHGLSLIEETVKSDDSGTGITVWVIKATRIENFIPLFPS